MRRPHRLTQRKDIRRVQQRGKTHRGIHISVRMFQSTNSRSRFAFAVRREAGKAVSRNLVRRRLREICRSLPVAPGWDVVISARPSAIGISFKELASDVQNTLSKSGLINEASS
jgi:ribonuclease P protein component